MTSVCLIRNSSLLRSPNTDASKNYLKEISLALQKSLCGFGKRSSEAATGDVLWEKVFLEISQNSQKNSSARVSFSINLQAWGLRPATLLKKSFWHRCFPANFAKFLRTPSLTEQLCWLPLDSYILGFYNDSKACSWTQARKIGRKFSNNVAKRTFM